METRVLIQYSQKTLCSLSPTPVMLHIKFDQDWRTGFRDIQVWMCGRRTDDGPLVCYKLTLWAFGSGELKMHKIRLQRDFFKLATNDLSDKMFLLTSKFRQQGVVSPCPRAIYMYMYKIMKRNCVKSEFKEIFLKLDRSDKRFLLTSKFCSLGLSASDLRLYTFI